MKVFYFAYLLAYTLGADQFAAAGNTPNAPGVEVRILEVLGPHGTTQSECEAFADGQRQRAAKQLRLVDHRLLKYACVPMQLSTK